MQTRLDKIGRDVISKIKYWTGPPTMEWDAADIEEYTKLYTDAPDSDIAKKIYATRFPLLGRYCIPPEEFWIEVSKRMVSESKWKPKARLYEKFEKSVEKYRKLDLKTVNPDTIKSGYDTCAYHYLIGDKSPEKDKMFKTLWFLLAISYTHMDMTEWAVYEQYLLNIIRSAHLTLFLPKELVLILMKQENDMFERMLAGAKSKTFVVHQPEGVSPEEIDRTFREQILRGEMASNVTSDVKGANIGDISDPRLK